MKLSASCLLALLLTAAGAHAQVTGISESTDPARIAAVEARARAIQARDHARTPTTSGPMHGTTHSGWPYLSGGVATGGRHAMMAERNRFNLWVATVAKPSGAYLAGVALRIEDSKDASKVLDTRMSGPWLMVELPPGRYDVSGTYRAGRDAQPQTLTTQVDVAAGAHRQAILRFDSPAEVGPRASGGDPFAAPMSSN